MGSIGFSPELLLFQDPINSNPFKELLPLLPVHGSRHGLSRSNMSVSHEHNDLQKLRSGLHGYSQFVNYLAMKGMPLPAQFQDMHDDSLLSCFDMDGQWKNRKEFLEFLMSRSSNIKEDYLAPPNRPELREVQAIPADMYQRDVETIKFQLENSFGANGSFRHANGYPYNQDTDSDFVLDVPYPSMRLHLEGRSSFVDNLADMKDLGSVLAEFAVLKDSAQSTKHQVLVPHFTWGDAIALQDRLHSSPVILKTVTASPLKSPKKVHKRKTKKATTERNLYRDNSFHAFETILSLMVDKNHNGKSMMNSLKKSSPALPQLLTQVSASIAGTGLAVMFSVIYKVACGTVPFSTPNLLTSGFVVGLFWLSGAVNRLRDTIIYIRKNFSKTGFEDEGMITKVDDSVKAILFRVTALMAVLMLRFA